MSGARGRACRSAYVSRRRWQLCARRGGLPPLARPRCDAAKYRCSRGHLRILDLAETAATAQARRELVGWKHAPPHHSRDHALARTARRGAPALSRRAGHRSRSTASTARARRCSRTGSPRSSPRTARRCSARRSTTSTVRAPSATRAGGARPEGFYRDSFDYATFRRALIDPFRDGGQTGATTGFQLAAFDLAGTRRSSRPGRRRRGMPCSSSTGSSCTAPSCADLWDWSVWLDVPYRRRLRAHGAARRVRPRPRSAPSNARYRDGQELYLNEARPRSRGIRHRRQHRPRAPAPRVPGLLLMAARRRAARRQAGRDDEPRRRRPRATRARHAQDRPCRHARPDGDRPADPRRRGGDAAADLHRRARQDLRGDDPARRRRPTPTTPRARSGASGCRGPATSLRARRSAAIAGLTGADLAGAQHACRRSRSAGGAPTTSRGRASEVELQAREVTVSRFDVLASAERRRFLDLDVVVDCSSGTYIRALARDLGGALGVGGHLTALRRTRIGPFDVDGRGIRRRSRPRRRCSTPADVATAVLGASRRLGRRGARPAPRQAPRAARRSRLAAQPGRGDRSRRARSSASSSGAATTSRAS